MTTPRTTLLTPAGSRAIAMIAIVVLVAGCATRRPAPVVERAPVPPALPAPVAAPQLPPAPLPAQAVPAAPPDARPPSYTVKRGDTLYQIALEHGLDYRELAAWNGIANTGVIRAGQELRLTAPGSETAPAAGGTTITPLRTTPSPSPGDTRPSAVPAVAAPAVAARPADGSLRTSPKAVKEPWSEQAVRDVERIGTGVEPAVVARAEPSARAVPPASTLPAPAASAPASPAPAASPSVASAPSSSAGTSPGDDEGLDWVWPAKGRLVAQFSENASLKGIDIAGAAGDAVLASAPGKVVYAGSGLRGYGKLVIIRHNATYLTAYAHNRDILVKEGQAVARGQKIAEMGSTDADRVKLHFEIRRLGKPMDPLRFLPPA